MRKKRVKDVLKMIEVANEVLWDNKVTDATKYENGMYVYFNHLLLRTGNYQGYNCFSINAQGIKVLDPNGIVQFY